MASLLFGFAVGSLRPPVVERVFWGVVVAAMMQTVCATVILFDHDKGIYAWPLAAGFAAVPAASDGYRIRRMLLAAAISGTVITIYMLSTTAALYEILANVVCALIGGAFTVVVDRVRRLGGTNP